MPRDQQVTGNLVLVQVQGHESDYSAVGSTEVIRQVRGAAGYKSKRGVTGSDDITGGQGAKNRLEPDP